METEDHFDNPRAVTERAIARQRRRAKLQMGFAFLRAGCWTVLMLLHLVGVPFTNALFASVAFVAMVSLYANAVTDFGVGLAAYSAIVGADSRQDAYQSGDILLHRINANVEQLVRRQEGE